MPNYLKMPKKSQVLALLELGWSYRRIEAETGVRRETVSGYDAARQANAAKTFPGSDPSPPRRFRSMCPAADGSNAAKTFAGSGANPAKTFPGSTPRPRFAAARLSHGDHREARRRSEPAADLAGPGRGVRLRRELRIGETVRADDRADAASRRRLSLCPRRRGASRFLPRRADARRRDGRVATAVGVSDDAGPLAARLRGSGLGSEARDVSPAARARVPRSRRRADGRSPRQSQSGRRARVLLRSRQPRGLSRVRRALGLHAAADAAAPPAGKREAGAQRRLRQRQRAQGPPLRQPRRAECVSAALESHHRAAAHSRHDAPPGVDALCRGRAAGAAARSPARRFRSSPAASARSTPMATSKSAARSIRCRSRCSGQRLRVRWDAHLVRVFHGDTLVMVHARVAAGVFAPRAGEAEASTRQQAFVDRLVGQCERVGPARQAVGRRRARRARRPRHSPHSRRPRPDATPSARARPRGRHRSARAPALSLSDHSPARRAHAGAVPRRRSPPTIRRFAR